MTITAHHNEPGSCVYHTEPSQDTLNGNLPILIFIPGNPGLVDYYQTYLGLVQRRFPKLDIWCISHAGFSTAHDGVRQKVETYYNLEDQVEHKFRIVRDLISKKRNPTQNVSLYFLSHSVGSWILQRLIKKLEGEECLKGKYTIEFSGMICPTISDIKISRSGKVFTFLCAYLPLAYMACLVSIFLRAILLENCIRYIISKQLGTRPKAKDDADVIDGFNNALEATFKLVSSPAIIRQIIHLAQDEMVAVNKDDTINDWYFKDFSKSSAVWVFFAKEDLWVHNQTRDLTLERYLVNSNVRFDVDSTDADIEHSFCVGQSSEFAEITIKAIEETHRNLY